MTKIYSSENIQIHPNFLYRILIREQIKFSPSKEAIIEQGVDLNGYSPDLTDFKLDVGLKKDCTYLFSVLEYLDGDLEIYKEYNRFIVNDKFHI